MVAPCAICGKPVVAEHKPFCSKRCADIDLGKWISGSYSVPVVETDDLPDDDAENEALEH